MFFIYYFFAAIQKVKSPYGSTDAPWRDKHLNSNIKWKCFGSIF